MFWRKKAEVSQENDLSREDKDKLDSICICKTCRAVFEKHIYCNPAYIYQVSELDYKREIKQYFLSAYDEKNPSRSDPYIRFQTEYCQECFNKKVDREVLMDELTDKEVARLLNNKFKKGKK